MTMTVKIVRKLPATRTTSGICPHTENVHICVPAFVYEGRVYVTRVYP